MITIDGIQYYGEVYERINIINGKVYVGQSIRENDARWQECLREARKGIGYRLGDGIRENGEASFRKECRYLVKLQPDLKKCQLELDRMETFFIILRQSHLIENGYNMTLGGRREICTEERNKKISKSKSGKYWVTNEVTSKSIPKSELPPEGFRKGFKKRSGKGKRHPVYKNPQTPEVIQKRVKKIVEVWKEKKENGWVSPLIGRSSPLAGKTFEEIGRAPCPLSGRTRPPEVVKKQSASIKKTIEKQKTEGKIFVLPQHLYEENERRRGKTNDEIYGEERAKEISINISAGLKQAFEANPWPSSKNPETTSRKRKENGKLFWQRRKEQGYTTLTGEGAYTLESRQKARQSKIATLQEKRSKQP